TRAGGVEGQRVIAEEDEPLLTAGGAAEHRFRRRAEAAAPRSLLLLARTLEARPRPFVAALGVLVAPLAVFLIVGHWNPFSRRREECKGVKPIPLMPLPGSVPRRQAPHLPDPPLPPHTR